MYRREKRYGGIAQGAVSRRVGRYREQKEEVGAAVSKWAWACLTYASEADGRGWDCQPLLFTRPRHSPAMPLEETPSRSLLS